MTRSWALVLVFPLLVRAQSGRTEIAGTLRDPSRLPIAGAAIRLTYSGTGLELNSTTTVEGGFHFFALPPGEATLSASADSFQPIARPVTIRTGDHLSLDLTIQPSTVSETIEVSATAPLLQASKGTVSFIATQQQVVTLPLDGRNFVPLIARSPGVSLPPGSVFPRINGSRPRVSEYLYDGLSVLQPEPGQVAFYPVIDAIEEFRVETNSYSAEFGRSNGGVIIVNQKSGTNQFRGTLFEFFRHDALNARNYFAPPGDQLRFRRNQYGFIFGGPIVRNRTFFFGDWQGTRLRTGVIRFSTVPAAAERQGVFRTAVFDPLTTSQGPSGFTRQQFPNNTVPLSRWDTAARGLLDRYPLPNVAGATANNYRRTGVESADQDQFDTRLDHLFSERHRAFARYSYLRDFSTPIAPLPGGDGVLAAGVIGATRTRADSIATELTSTLSPNRVNQLRFGWTRRGFDRSALRTGVPASQATGIPGIPQSSFGDVLPAFELAGLQQLGAPANGNADFTTSVTQIYDVFSWTAGRHSIKAGADWRWQRLDVLQPPSPTGLFQFNNVLTAGLTPQGAPLAGTGTTLASFLLGQVQNFSIDLQDRVLGPRATIGEFFLQDDWRVTPRFTLNLGVRYTLNFPSTVAGDRGAVFNLESQRLDFLGQNGFPRSARDLELGNFAPRFGFAWNAAADFVLRGGYGLTWIEQAGITTPFTTPLFPFIRTAGQRSLDNRTPAFVLAEGPSVSTAPPDSNSGLGPGVFGVQRDQKSGYAQQWNLSLQRTFGQTWSVEAGYLGSKLTNLGVPDVNQNQLPTEFLALGPALTQTVPNPFFGQIPPSSALGGPTIARQQLLRPYPRFTTVALYRNNVGHSTYHSFQARIEKRYAGGLLWTFAYTFSKLIDDAGAVFDSAILTGPAASFQVADSYNRRGEKDVSTGNIPHNLSSGFVYDLPWGRGRRIPLDGWRHTLLGGWQVAGILRLQSGSPVAVTQVPNLNAFAGFGVQRPNRIADPRLPGDQRSPARWFDTAAFTAAPQFTLGNSSRNPVVGPPFRSLDVMVGKTIAITERWRAEFRAEAFNVTNTPQFGNPNGSFGTPAFGTIASAFDPRVFELVLKLHF